jgi:Protein of unknown function (DUF3105)
VANRGGTGSGRDDADHRSTKAQRKEQARQERERIQQQMHARHRNRNIGLALVALALVIVVVAIFVLQPKGLPSPATLLSQAAAATKTAGCTPPQPEGYYDNLSPTSTGYDDRTHIGSDPRFPTMPPLSTYPSVPPASGPHNPTPLNAGVYGSPPPVDQAIHSLEHAAAIIWYSPTAPGKDIDQIKRFYTQKADVGQAKIIVAPYSYPSQGTAGQLPSGVEMAIVAWHFVQTCAKANLAVAYSFTSQYSNATPGAKYIGTAPEPQVAI